MGNMPGNVEALTKGVSVESEIQLNNQGWNGLPWHSRGMYQILVKSRNGGP